MINSSKQSAAQWQSIITAFKESGLSQSEYCRQHNLKLSSFNKWLHKLAPTAESDFIPINPSVATVQDRVIDLTLGNWFHLVIRIS